jgi:hypothetical protein
MVGRERILGYAMLLPIGPDEVELERTRDLMESISAYAPNVKVCVVVDCAVEPRDWRARLSSQRNCEVVSLPTPYRGVGKPLLGRQCAEILSALKVVYEYRPFDFILKIDTDALVIAPFFERLTTILQKDPGIGIAGAVGRTCKREAPDYGFEARVLPRWIRLLQSIPEGVFEKALHGLTQIKIRNAGVIDSRTLHLLDAIRTDVEAALQHGYSSLEYCQGGAYVLSPEFLERMVQYDFLRDPSRWLYIPVAEDVLVGMYARAVGLKVVDCSSRGEPFGVQFRGLAYPPSELVERGYSFIHSVKNDPSITESNIRGYFRALRVSHIKTGLAGCGKMGAGDL